MNLTVVIVLCIAITLALIIFPLIVSYKVKKSKKNKEDEWDKIANYGNKINEKSRKNKLH